MKNKILSFLLVPAVCIGFAGVAHADVSSDTEDPMFLNAMGDFVSRSGMSFSDDILLLSQDFTYGFNNRFSLGADINYQQDMDGPDDGFSDIGIGGIYRFTNGSSNILSDAIFGVNFGGNAKTPFFADTVYYAGMRVGRQWSGVTLAATLKSSWIFDDVHGMAYFDFSPEAYFRMTSDWMAGIGFDVRKSTTPSFDRQWANVKLVRRYGKTEYVGVISYEFQDQDFQFGAKVNILF